MFITVERIWMISLYLSINIILWATLFSNKLKIIIEIKNIFKKIIAKEGKEIITVRTILRPDYLYKKYNILLNK